MAGFDIANMRNRKSFAASLKKRKALGLNDSDSEDDSPKRKNLKKAAVKKVETENDPDELSMSTTKPTTPTKPKENIIEIDPSVRQMQETLNTTSQYLAEAEALMSKPVNIMRRPEPTLNKKEISSKPIRSSQSNNSSAIELSDDEGEEEEISVGNDDILDLDPELAKILKESASTPSRQATKVNIKLTYVHNFTQVSENAKAVIDKLIKPVKIIILDNDQFHTAVNAFCKKKNLKKSDIVLTYKNNLVFLNSTPAGVGMTEVGTHLMEVYPEKCYNDMQREKEAKRLEMRRKLAEEANKADKIDDSHIPEAPVEQPEDNNRIKLTLRDSKNNDMSVKVKPTTILSSLVAAYKQRTGTTGDVKLSFEGEILELDQSVENTDLEDEDMIEVIL